MASDKYNFLGFRIKKQKWLFGVDTIETQILDNSHCISWYLYEVSWDFKIEKESKAIFEILIAQKFESMMYVSIHEKNIHKNSNSFDGGSMGGCSQPIQVFMCKKKRKIK